MFCQNCGAQLSDDAKFCENCGTASAAVTPPVQPAPPASSVQSSAPSHLKKKTPLIIGIAAGVLVLLTAGIIVITRITAPRPGGPQVSAPTAGKDAQFIRDLSALSESVNDYRNDSGVMTFNLTEKNVERVYQLILKYLDGEFFESDEIYSPLFFPGYAGMYARECNVTISYDEKKSGRERSIELFSPARKRVYFTKDGYFQNRKLPEEK